MFRLSAYHKRHQVAKNLLHHIDKDLSSLERHLINSHELVAVRGKRGSKVPILLPSDIQPLMAYIADPVNRKTANIVESGYFFATKGKYLVDD